MKQGSAFTKQDVFEQMLREIRTADGNPYQDPSTIYGDMSRLVVAWLAETSPNDIIQIYNKLGWKGTANGRALHVAACHWMKTYHSQPANDDRAAD